jgi:hypothetical protein
MEHQGTLDRALRIVTQNFLVVDLNALRSYWVSIPVILLLLIALAKL